MVTKYALIVFPACCGAYVAHTFNYYDSSTLKKEMDVLEKTTTGIIVVILNKSENDNVGKVFAEREGWEPFCHHAVNPNTGNELFGYAFTNKKPKVVEPVKPVFAKKVSTVP